jgi:hypothetical protein
MAAIVCPIMAVAPTDPLPEPADAARTPGCVDEWVFAAWLADASLGVISGHRLQGRRAWYWSALVGAGRPLLHLAEWEVPIRSDPFVVKAPEMWAEHHCVAAWEQWSIGNEAFFVALDDPADALGRAYGTPTPTAIDLEWYATGTPEAIPNGFEQPGTVHGRIELAGPELIELAEAPAWRWRRAAPGLAPIELAEVIAHTGLRAPFAFPDGTRSDWVLTRTGWRSRRSTE